MPEISEKQLLANKANALKSTGACTPEGRARSAQNARKHGFASTRFSLEGIEDPQELANLRADLFQTYQPVGPQEMFALERAALAQQQILRSYQFEAGTLSHFEDTPRELPRALYTAGRAFKNASPKGQQLPLLLRYQARAERMYRRAIDEFERLKSHRSAPPADFPNEPILDTQPTENMQLLISEEALSDGDLFCTSIRPDDSPETGTREASPDQTVS
jgi:hypothetical protein